MSRFAIRALFVAWVVAMATAPLWVPSVRGQAAVTVEDRLAAVETRVALHEALLGLVTPTLTPVPAMTPTPTAAPSATPTTTEVVPTATAEPTATGTPEPTLTATLTPTSEPAPTATSTPTVESTVTVTPSPSPTAQPVAGQPCPAWYHDRITTTGPDGATYPTWHPATDPTTGCRFGHEHGDDPRTSIANSAMPSFGYIGRLVGDEEPHVGFKVFVQNAGSVNDDGRTLAHHSRMVFHMGTAGPKRFTTRFHSLEYDFVQVRGDRNGVGHEVHVAGMADTGGVGSICANPRQGKTVMVLPNLCQTDSNYEIWAAELRLGRVTVVTAFAVFDPITLLDPADPSRFLLMETYYPNRWPPYYSCKREAYSGPVYFYNGSGGGLQTFRTDAYGAPRVDGPLVQRVSRHNDLGVWMTTDETQTQAKLASNHCTPGLQSPN